VRVHEVLNVHAELKSISVSGGYMLSPESVLPGVQESDRKLVGSMFVVKVPNIEAAKEIVEGDQYWIHNVVRTFILES
jgi:uncharacterized protein YciI